MVTRKLQQVAGKATLTLVGAGLAFAVWLAAPALSLEPYVPEPVDFELRDAPIKVEMSAPVLARAARSQRRANTVLRSRALRAPKRFNLVGLRWQGAREAELSMRVRRGGQRWSHWLEVPVDPDHAPDPTTHESAERWSASDPLWAGEADEIQYRIAAAKAVRNIHLHFVNSKGTATPLDRLRSKLRRAAHTAVASFASVFGGNAAAEGSPQPEIVMREQWGASACPPRATPAYGEVKLAFVHHTVTATDYAPEDSAPMVLGVCRYHRNSNRWNDIGYQFVVDRYGKIFEGRAGGIDQAVVGAQAQGYNSQSTGIANLGTFSTSGQTEEGLAALARLISWKLALHGAPSQGKVAVRSAGGALNRYPAGREVLFDRISGHRDGDKTACPGDGLYAQLPRLRGMVTADPRAPTTLALSAVRSRIPYGRKARLSGTLGTAVGGPLSAQGVRIQALGGVGTSHTLAKVATGFTGAFAVNVRLAFNRTLQASFEGAPTLRPAQSLPLAVGVRPRVTASLGSPVPSHVAVRQRVLIRGSVRPRKRLALLLVDRQGSDGAFRRVAKLPAAVRLGRIRTYYRFRKPGRYRVRLGVDRDERNFSARSQALTIDVG